MQVKGNQPSLRGAVAHLAQTAPALDRHSRMDLDRRRHPQRTVGVFAAQGLPAPWAAHIAAVVQVQRLTDAFCTQTGRWRGSHESRYDVCSRLASATVFAAALRGHWGIENHVPYVKDVSLREDASRLRQHPGIFARLRSFALNLLRANGESNISLAIYQNALGIDRVLHYVGVLR